MSKYRFKTREEFIRDGLWDEKDNCPYYWSSNGDMNEYLGKDVPDKRIVHCDKNEEFTYDGWLFQNTDYTLKEQQEYFDDLSQHIGRYIRALVDNPHAGMFVKKGDIGKIISYEKADFPNRKSYSCTCALSKDFLGVKYELLPEDYSPEQKTKESGVEFIPGKWYKYNGWYIKYKDHVDDIWRSSEQINYSKKYSKIESRFGERDSDDKKILLLDLSEIQEYLPDGHPDKIINQKFEIGKWYKWYQKNHGNYHYGKVKEININTDTVVMSPWIIHCNSYNYSGSFYLSKAEQIQEISVEDVQEFLPKDHPDKIASNVFKKGEYIVITDNYYGGFCTNYIYKQRKDYEYLEAELDNNGSTTNGFARYEKKNPYNWRYATQEEIDEYERRGNPYDVTELQKKELSMEEIQEECKKRFPIGCTYIPIDNDVSRTLKKDSSTYYICGNMIYAYCGGGCLYSDGKWAELISLPEENITEVPEYIECTKTRETYFIKGNIYKVINSKNLYSVILRCNNLSNFREYNNLYVRLENNWKPSTKEAYEQQKNQLGSPEESTSKVVPSIDPYEGAIANIFTYDEVGQYLSTAFDYWKEIPKFTEQKEFDIYGPTPDIE